MGEDSRRFEQTPPAKLPTNLEELLWGIELYLVVATMTVAVVRLFS